MRARLKNVELDLQLEKEGYLVLSNWINASQLATLNQVFITNKASIAAARNGLNSLLVNDIALRKQISDSIMAVLGPSLEDSFIEYIPFFGYFMVKPTQGGQENFHRDYSITNEDEFDYLTLWLPLEDIDTKSGCLQIIPKSHQLFHYPLPIDVAWPYSALTNTLQSHAVDVPMQAGDLLLFFAKTIHASYPNLSDNPSHVVSTNLIHPDTQMVHYYYSSENNEINTYEVDSWLYFRHEIGNLSDKYPVKESFAFEPTVVSTAAIKKFYNQPYSKESVFQRLIKWMGLGF
jgi:hypothetical protein